MEDDTPAQTPPDRDSPADAPQTDDASMATPEVGGDTVSGAVMAATDAEESFAAPAQTDRGPSTPGVAQSNPQQPGFVPATLDRTVIAVPLLNDLVKDDKLGQPHKLYAVVIEINLDFQAGPQKARECAAALVLQVIDTRGSAANEQGLDENKNEVNPRSSYLYARLEGDVIRELARRDSQTDQGMRKPAAQQCIHRIWPDFPLKALTYVSVSTVKADAARASFSALGKDVVWAVLDSGIQGDHPHFKLHQNLSTCLDKDFTALTGGDPFTDAFGHGTHVAGIIAGELKAAGNNGAQPGPPLAAPDLAAAGAAPLATGEPTPAPPQIRAFTRYRDVDGAVKCDPVALDAISGMAPMCKLVSLKVLDNQGQGNVSNLITALEYIQQINDYGRRLRIHGVNMSVGYNFEPEWFACGQSPLCVEVDRLVRSGVVVVVAAGNSGYGFLQTEFRGTSAAGMELTINDPGNADLAITVGSTHREQPHVYGVSYFSSKGPTGDGRLKPDLVAPGEKIVSCAAGQKLAEANSHRLGEFNYVEDSGTSMAAPHVSGVIAAFLSVRKDYIGRPEDVKDIFLSSATDLKRDAHFQGHGLVDLMRAIQAV